jgi:catechol 2,3-dioxygenase-like lactoylglutathione lyase family enzyme
VDWKLEVVIVPVADVDRAKEFYADKLGFPLDVDHQANENFRIVQVTPPGSGCSIVFGKGVGSDAAPGSVKGNTFVVSDIEAALAHLEANGIANNGIVHFEGGSMVPGPDPARQKFNSFIYFEDPDGNTWAVQEGERKAG